MEQRTECTLDQLLHKMYAILPLKLRARVDDFANKLECVEYSLFLSHGPLDKIIARNCNYDSTSLSVLPRNLDRKKAAIFVLRYIVEYIEKAENEEVSSEEMGHAIDEFMHMMSYHIAQRDKSVGNYEHDYTYEQLCDFYGTCRQGYVKELFWKPKWMGERRYSNGSILTRLFYLDDTVADKYKKYFKTEFTWDKNGKILFETQGNGISIEYSWHDSGKMASKKTFKKEIMRCSETWDENVKETNYYKKGKLHGHCTCHEHGKLVKEADYVMGVLHGRLVEYENDLKILEVEYENGSKHGRMTSFHKNGKPMKEISYFKGKRMGEYKEWHDNGKNKIMGKYTEGKKTGFWIEYDPTGSKIMEGWYENDLMSGIWRTYHKGTKILESEETHEKGSRTGLSKRWYVDQTLQFEGNYDNGARIGTWRWFHPNGNPKEIANYVNGKLDGKYKCWRSNGKHKMSGYYSNGDRVGVWKSWSKHGLFPTEEVYS